MDLDCPQENNSIINVIWWWISIINKIINWRRYKWIKLNLINVTSVVGGNVGFNLTNTEC